jgi:hypothetical protein
MKILITLNLLEIISQYCPAVTTVTIKHRKASSRICKCIYHMSNYLKFLMPASKDSIITIKQKLWTDFTLPSWYIVSSKKISFTVRTYFRNMINVQNFRTLYDAVLVFLLQSLDVCIKIKKKKKKKLKGIAI